MNRNPSLSRRVAASVLLSAATTLLVAQGCGPGYPSVDSSLTEAKVKGLVKLKGKAAEGGGTISFNPSNVERKVGSITAKIEPDGSYTLASFTGGNEVKFSGPFLKDAPQVALSSRYCELEPGENVVDFDLLGEDDKPRGTIYARGSKVGPAKKRGR